LALGLVNCNQMYYSQEYLIEPGFIKNYWFNQIDKLILIIIINIFQL